MPQTINYNGKIAVLFSPEETNGGTQIPAGYESFPGFSTPSGLVVVTDGAEPSLTRTSAAVTSTGSGAGSSYTPNYVLGPISGQQIDVGSEAGRQAFFAEQQQVAQQQIDRLNREYGVSREDAERFYTRQLTQISNELTALADQETQGRAQIQRQIDDTNQGVASNEASIQSRYSAASPSAFQSSQIDSGVANREAGIRVLGDIALAKNQFENELGVSRRGIAQDQEDLERSYNRFTTESDEAYRAAVAGINSQVGQIGAQFSSLPGANRFAYTLTSRQPVSAANVDTSGLVPYNGFSVLNSAAKAQGAPRNYFSQGATPGLPTYLQGGSSAREQNYFEDYVLGRRN